MHVTVTVSVVCRTPTMLNTHLLTACVNLIEMFPSFAVVYVGLSGEHAASLKTVGKD